MISAVSFLSLHLFTTSSNFTHFINCFPLHKSLCLLLYNFSLLVKHSVFSSKLSSPCFHPHHFWSLPLASLLCRPVQSPLGSRGGSCVITQPFGWDSPLMGLIESNPLIYFSFFESFIKYSLLPWDLSVRVDPREVDGHWNRFSLLWSFNSNLCLVNILTVWHVTVCIRSFLEQRHCLPIQGWINWSLQ